MAKNSELITVDYRSIMAIPPSVRSQMAARGSIDPLLGVLTPGQRVALFPNYFKDSLSGLAGQRSEFGGIPAPKFASGITPNSPRTGNTTSVDSSVLPPSTKPMPKIETGSFGSDTKQKAGNLVLKLQKDLGLTKIQAAAVAGNFMHESGGFKHMQEIKPTAGRGGYGWAQWTGPRRKNFEAYVQANGLDARSDEANYGFFIHEINNDPYEKSQFEKWRETPYESVDSAAMGFDKYYERSGVKSYESRIEYAKQAIIASDEIQAAATSTPVAGQGSIVDDTLPIGGDPTAVPMGVVAAGSVGEILDGTPVSAAQQAVDRSLEALGLNERENKDLLKDYLSGKNLDPEQTAWCANFVNTSLASAGLRGTGSDIANSFQNYGTGIEFNNMTKGDIVVDTDSRRADETGGHVMQATGRSRINEKTGELEFEVVGGNQSDAVTTKYVSQKPDIVVRRSTEANLVQPPVASAVPGITTAPEQPVATQTETAVPATVTQASLEPKEDGGFNIADAAFLAMSASGKMLTGVPGALASMTAPAGAGEDEQMAKINAEWAAKTEAERNAEIKRKLETTTADSGVATNSMAAGGMIAEPHTAINDRTGEKTKIGEKGTGGEFIVPRNKVDAAELGQQPYQMPQSAPQPSQRETIVETAVEKVQAAPRMNATGQQAPSSGGVTANHPVAPPSARKAYADAGLESRFNNFSPLGTQYRSFGA
jgi:uncharacterized protein (TIGR02594 family)